MQLLASRLGEFDSEVKKLAEFSYRLLTANCPETRLTQRCAEAPVAEHDRR